jgi:hypothetical protein
VANLQRELESIVNLRRELKGKSHGMIRLFNLIVLGKCETLKGQLWMSLGLAFAWVGVGTLLVWRDNTISWWAYGTILLAMARAAQAGIVARLLLESKGLM